MCPIAAALADRRFLAWGLVLTGASLLGFGLVAAIIPNPVFGRSVPPEPFAIGVWLVSAPLMGLLAASFVVPAAPRAEPVGLTVPAPMDVALIGPSTPRAARPASAAAAAVAPDSRGSALGTVAGFGAFLAIGCPLCNKIALVALGASGAMSIWAPLQPIVGAVSVAMLAGTVAWRLRRRARGDACSAPLAARRVG